MAQKVMVVEKIMDANDRLAQQNQARLDAAGVFAVNVMASPGAGKTSLILKTIAALKGRCRIGVIEGDTAPVTRKRGQPGLPGQLPVGNPCQRVDRLGSRGG